MYYKSKYIIIDTGMAAVPVVFGELIQHAVMAHGLGGGEVLGAGFCFIEVVDGQPRYKCYGESISLKVQSRENEDARILNKYLGVVHDE